MGRRMSSRLPSGVRAPDSEKSRSTSTSRRVDEDRRPRRQLDGDALEPEGVFDHDLGLLDGIAAARDAPEDVPAAEPAVPPVERRLALTKASHRLAEDERARGNVTLGVQLELHRHVVARQPLAAAECAPERHRALEHADPERRGQHGEDEADRHRVEHLRAERPGGEVDPAPESEDPAAAVRHRMFGR